MVKRFFERHAAAMDLDARRRQFAETFVITGRELGSYFSTPIAYIVIFVFLAFTGFFFFKDFFMIGQAEMRGFFQLLPLVFCFVIPAVTMRLFSEEIHSGTIEILMTLPVSTLQTVVAKVLAGTAFVAVMLAPTLVYFISVLIVGSPDAGPVIGGFLGALLLGAAYSSVGVLASSLSRNQIIAFISSLSACFLLWLLDKITIFIPVKLVFVEYLGSDFHFRTISRGIIDLRDIVYFVSLIVLSVLLTVRVIERRR